MYIDDGRQVKYARDGAQVCPKGAFLILVRQADPPPGYIPCPGCAGIGRRPVLCGFCGGPKIACLVAGTCLYAPNCEREASLAQIAADLGWGTIEALVTGHAFVAECGYGCYGSGRIRSYASPPPSPLRALVRSVTLRQLGHFMMGTVRIGAERYSISGAYGGDGLGISVSPEIYAQALPVPDELVAAWNHGGGHNDAGSEALAMRDWARANLPALLPSRARKGAKKS